jgi:hypothetical protein
MTVYPLEYNVRMKYVNNECGRMETKKRGGLRSVTVTNLLQDSRPS